MIASSTNVFERLIRIENSFCGGATTGCDPGDVGRCRSEVDISNVNIGDVNTANTVQLAPEIRVPKEFGLVIITLNSQI